MRLVTRIRAWLKRNGVTDLALIGRISFDMRGFYPGQKIFDDRVFRQLSHDVPKAFQVLGVDASRLHYKVQMDIECVWVMQTSPVARYYCVGYDRVLQLDLPFLKGDAAVSCIDIELAKKETELKSMVESYYREKVARPLATCEIKIIDPDLARVRRALLDMG